MAIYTDVADILPIVIENATVARRITPLRPGVFLRTYNMSPEQPAPSDFIDYPREYPLEHTWTALNPKS